MQSLISVNPEPKFILFKFSHKQKADAPIDLTLSGMLTFITGVS